MGRAAAVVTVGGPVGETVDITVHTIARTYLGLKIALQILGIEVLLVDTPAHRCAREETVAVVLTEVRCTVVASGECEQILVLIVVVDTAEVTHHLVG